MSGSEFFGDASTLTDAQLLRLMYSLWDFQQALSAITFLMEECDFEAKYSAIELRRFRCYESNAIISFARPFEGSRGQTALGLRAIGVQLDEVEKKLQSRLMNLRRKVIAHSDDDAMHFRGDVIQPLDDTDLTIPIFRFQESLYLSHGDLRPFEALLRRLTQAIGAALFRLAQTNPERISRHKTPTSI